MKKIFKWIIPALASCLFLWGAVHTCTYGTMTHFHEDAIAWYTNRMRSQQDLHAEFGYPTSNSEIILKNGISLYEFQGGLYKFIPEDDDSLIVVQNIYKKGDMSAAVWYVPLSEDSIKILDVLIWNHKWVQF